MDDLIEKKVQATPKQAAFLFECGGVAKALDALENLTKEFRNIPGIALAYQCIRTLDAEMRVDLASMALRAAAKGGIDMANNESVHTVPEPDGTVFFVANWKGRDGKKGGE